MYGREDWVCKGDKKRMNRDLKRKSGYCGTVKARGYSVVTCSDLPKKKKKVIQRELNHVLGLGNREFFDYSSKS